MSMTRVAVLLAAGLVTMSGCTGDTEGSPGPGRRQGTETASSETVHSWAQLPLGKRPEIPYIRGNRYLTPSGKVFALPAGKRGVSAVAAFSGGLLVSDAAHFEGTNGIALVERGVRLQSWPSASHCSSGGPVASADAGHVAWVTVRCPESRDRSIGVVHVARTDGSGEVTQEVGPGLVAVVGFLGGSIVYNVGFKDGAWIADLHDQPRLIPGVDRVLAASQPARRLIGQVGDQARLLIDAEGTVRWRAPTGDLISFSPDGTEVLSIVDGAHVSVLSTRNGETTAGVDLPAGADVWSTVWETNETLLALMELSGKVAIVRVFLDGHLERATPTVCAGSGPAPFALVQPPPFRSVTAEDGVRITTGVFVRMGSRGEFLGHGGQRAAFRGAPAGSDDPGLRC